MWQENALSMLVTLISLLFNVCFSLKRTRTATERTRISTERLNIQIQYSPGEAICMCFLLTSGYIHFHIISYFPINTIIINMILSKMVEMSISTKEASGLLNWCYNVKVYLILVLSSIALYCCGTSKIFILRVFLHSVHPYSQHTIIRLSHKETCMHIYNNTCIL